MYIALLSKDNWIEISQGPTFTPQSNILCCTRPIKQPPQGHSALGQRDEVRGAFEVIFLKHVMNIILKN